MRLPNVEASTLCPAGGSCVERAIISWNVSKRDEEEKNENGTHLLYWRWRRRAKRGTTPTTWPETEKVGRSDVSVLEQRLAAI